MRLYKDYLKERTDRSLIETKEGFLTYSLLGDSLYIVDIYIVPEARHKGAARALTDEVVKDAKEKGIKKLIGSVVPKTKGSTYALKAFLAYGFELESSVDNFIVLSKEIGD